MWLEIGYPHGNLPMVPWERLFHAELNAPILRVPYFALPSSPASGALDVAICASGLFGLSGLRPVRKTDKTYKLLDSAVTSLISAIDRPTVVHIFAAKEAQGRLGRMFKDRISTDGKSGVKIHEPGEARRGTKSLDESTEDGMFDTNNRWLDWMVQSLAAVTVDAVHFISAGQSSLDQGSLVLSKTPNSEQSAVSARYVGARQLLDFLTLAGASWISFSLPEDSSSGPGLRLLQHQVAMANNGTTALHDSRADPSCKSLAQAMALQFTTNGEVPNDAWLSIYCNPKLVNQQTEVEERRVSKFAQAYALTSLDSSTNQPWLRSAQRYVEQTAARFMEDEPLYAPDSPTREGTERAMKFVSELLSKYQLNEMKGEPGGPVGPEILGQEGVER